jgi:hypothetical protein
MANEIEVKSDSEKKKEDWMNSKWRPMMGWMYMLVCTMDFVGFPILWSLLQSASHGNVSSQWQPLTLQGAGLFHIAMGAVLGLAAYGRTQEKLGGANNGGLSLGSGTTYVPPGQGTVNLSNQPGMTGSNFGGSSGGFGASSGFGAPTSGSFNPAPSWGTTQISPAPMQGNDITVGFGGKKAPPVPDYPER